MNTYWFIITLGLILDSWAQNHLDNRIRKAELIRRIKKFKYEGAVRLVGADNPLEGNVEVFHGTKWGKVCDDEWDEKDAQVVCRQLELGVALSATHSSRFGHLDVDYFMDNVRCSGNETKLSDCRFDGWSNHDCGPDEVAGVVCHETFEAGQTTTPSTPSILKYSLKSILNEDFKVRLRGGRVDSEGRVEINTANDTDWTVLCGEGWSLLEAQVICRSVGMGYAQMATQSAFFLSDEDQKVSLSNVECRGNESSLRECSISTVVSGMCSPNSVAGVICTQYLADLVIDYHELMRSAYLEDRPMYLLQCAMEENCVASGAYALGLNWHLDTRRLLRFTASILNAGNAEFRPALPKHLWEFHQCHMHFHSMEVFASFDIYRGDEKVAEGHKASFCLEDNLCRAGVKPKFACANFGDQGISVNCSDIYKHNIDCQWVDISEIDSGIYTLKIAINPEFKVAEMSFENNAAVCNMYYGTSSVYISNCYLDRP